MIIVKNNHTFEPTKGASIRYLNQLGIVETDSFIDKPKAEDEESPYNLDNIEQMIDILNYGFTNDKKFFVQVDSDVDGITSSAIFYNYFKLLYPASDIEYRVHEGKQHGVILSTIPKNADIIIVPDAGSNQLNEQELLDSKGKTVLIMDHHPYSHKEEYENVLIVNNQVSDRFKNKNLSGAGVVYKIIQAYDQVYGKKILYKKFADLAAVGIISDMMDTTNLDNNFLIYHGLNNIHNNMLKHILEKQSFSVSSVINPTKIDIAFYVAPLINAVIRVGELEDKQRLFEGFINVGSDQIFESTWRGEERSETLYEYVSRSAVNLRSNQNRKKLKAVESINSLIEEQKLDKNKVIIICLDNISIPQTITGLIASDFVNNYDRPVLVLRPKKNADGEEVYAGSGRGIKAVGFPSFKNVLKNSNLVAFAEGHDMAFGVEISKELIPMLTDYLNETLKDVDFRKFNWVDCHMKDSNWNNDVLAEFGDMYRVYGAGIPEPKWLFTFDVDPKDCYIQGKTENSLRIEYKGISFVLRHNPELVKIFKELTKDSFKLNQNLSCSIVGRAQLNQWEYYIERGIKKYKVMIDQMDFKLVESTDFF